MIILAFIQAYMAQFLWDQKEKESTLRAATQQYPWVLIANLIFQSQITRKLLETLTIF